MSEPGNRTAAARPNISPGDDGNKRTNIYKVMAIIKLAMNCAVRPTTTFFQPNANSAHETANAAIPVSQWPQRSPANPPAILPPMTNTKHRMVNAVEAFHGASVQNPDAARQKTQNVITAVARSDWTSMDSDFSTASVSGVSNGQIHKNGVIARKNPPREIM